MIAALTMIVDCFGDRELSAEVREATCRGVPHGGGKVVAFQYFGPHLETTLRAVAPVIMSLDEMVPGFRDWIETSGYGDDRYMLTLLHKIANRLENMPKPGRRELLRRGIETFPKIERKPAILPH
jgi:hypothetical protein